MQLPDASLEQATLDLLLARGQAGVLGPLASRGEPTVSPTDLSAVVRAFVARCPGETPDPARLAEVVDRAFGLAAEAWPRAWAKPSRIHTSPGIQALASFLAAEAWPATEEGEAPAAEPDWSRLARSLQQMHRWVAWSQADARRGEPLAAEFFQELTASPADEAGAEAVALKLSRLAGKLRVMARRRNR
ncbi:MAG: hypothetical protein VKS61_18165 [Candidatus Sericytochromatia bacterium]|nr:hypothetical protein [Candidatus Sericytochromatia bacterium]